ncbi:Alpha-N-acetylgalactosaminidase [Oopsacas minuta]|uniref:Alpha-galactosidase n=1 Tax=Oopsacas minuta TaxID=111878 RepID=A0AAV7JY30_9METZ|nr:Alpha-N-acetylgalactosaminidase [Oopsacas minuta]
MDLIYLCCLLILSLSDVCRALDNGLALTPPMGWLSWERFACTVDCVVYPDACIGEKLILSQAHALIEKGLDKIGYDYVIIDDCWLADTRDNVTGELVPNPERFPNGMSYLVNVIHKLGVKFGIYGDMGSKTCGGYPGSWGHEQLDADTFAKWGVDYVKLDGCNIKLSDIASSYQLMGRSLNATKRHMVYSCSWPFYVWNAGLKINYTLLMDTCNLWRNYFDIQDSWSSVKRIIMFYAHNQDWMAALSGPGHWNDPDMILVGDFSLSKSQSEVQFGMWAMFSSPLILSVDMNNLADYALQIISNRDVIAVDQDSKGQQARMVYSSPDELWFVFKKELSDSSFAVAVLYLQDFANPHKYELLFNLINKTHSTFSVKDLFDGSVGNYTVGMSLFVNPNGIKLLKLTPLK